MANDTAVKLLGLSTEELVGQTLSSLCRTADAQAGLTATAINGAFLDIPSSALTTREGDLVPVFGRLVDVKGGETPSSVSLWVYPLRGPSSATSFSESLPLLRDNQEGRFLVIMEPVQRLRGEMTLGPKGRVFNTDAACGRVFGVHCESLLLGSPLSELVPGISCEALTALKAATSFSLTGLRRDSGNRFPLTVTVNPDLDEDGEVLKYGVELEVVETISGVASLTQDGFIRSFNTHFSQALTARPQAQLMHKHVSELIADFTSGPCSVGACSEEASTSQSADVSELAHRVRSLQLLPNIPKTDTNANRVLPKPLEGAFRGSALHVDGSRVPVSYHVRRLAGGEGKRPHYCLWLLWQLDPPPPPPSPTDPNATSPTNKPKLSAHGLDMWVGDDCLGETCDGQMGCGHYADTYKTLNQIGKGAFGAVKLAVRRTDEFLVVTKFICKAKVLSGAWCESSGWSEKVPIEIHLLSTLSHPNIVSVVSVFDNEFYYQLVMERHGSGMDLFEFIDREPKMDEQLVSHIFRQTPMRWHTEVYLKLVSAVSYLDGLGVVHRDLKDENIIIDESFRIKLIDFGSAAYYKTDDVPFATFCGTIEYASPEILLGNRYRGPEAEVWSLGVLLFTLEFGEAPFQTPEETIEANFAAPWEVSEGLDHLLSWLLQPAPSLRATIKQVERHWWTLQPVDSSRYRLKDVLSNAAPDEVAPLKYLNGRAAKGSETGSE